MSERRELLPCLFSRTLVTLAAGGLLAVLAPAGVVQAQEKGPELSPELAEVREALDQYRDPYLAVRDGYLSTLGCIVYPEGGEEGEVKYDRGAMGVHFMKPQLLDGELDRTEPEILVYDREPDGTLRLVAAEWMVPEQAADGRPTLFGQEFQGPMEGHEPLMPTAFHHYDLHAWLWRDNPAGRFAPTNPAMECPESAYTVREDAPDLVATSEPSG